MANVIDMYTWIGEETQMDFEWLRHVARQLQKDDVLPRGKRGSKARAPQVTVEHCALFLLGLAGSTRPRDSTEGVRTFAPLIGPYPDTDGRRSTLLEDLVAWIELVIQALESENIPDELLFIHDPDWPRVEISALKIGDEVEEGGPAIYCPDGKPPSGKSLNSIKRVPAFIINGFIFELFACLHRQPMPEAEGAE